MKMAVYNELPNSTGPAYTEYKLSSMGVGRDVCLRLIHKGAPLLPQYSGSY